LNVVTARQFERSTLSQIGSFGWLELFDRIIVTNQLEQKHERIRSNLKIGKTDWFVGDTGADIESGKKLGIRTAAVLSGFMSRESLQSYNPDLIVNSVVDLKISSIIL
jgi:phosphoglycolate phosphatase